MLWRAELVAPSVTFIWEDGSGVAEWLTGTETFTGVRGKTISQAKLKSKATSVEHRMRTSGR
jgi:hypothetical protein